MRVQFPPDKKLTIADKKMVASPKNPLARCRQLVAVGGSQKIHQKAKLSQQKKDEEQKGPPGTVKHDFHDTSVKLWISC